MTYVRAALAGVAVLAATGTGASGASADGVQKDYEWKYGDTPCSGNIWVRAYSGNVVADHWTRCSANNTIPAYVRVTLRKPDGTPRLTASVPFGNPPLWSSVERRAVIDGGAVMKGDYTVCGAFTDASGVLVGSFTAGAAGREACTSGPLK